MQLCLCVCKCVWLCVLVRVPVCLLSMHVSGMNNLFPFLRQNPPITTPPSSLFIMYSWVSVSAGLWLALNEQLTALSVSQCYGNEISQSVQKKHQSTTGTETLFNPSGETACPSGRLTYWILSTAWYLRYGSRDVSNSARDQVRASWNALDNYSQVKREHLAHVEYTI